MSDHQQTLQKVRQATSTHNCPKCQGPAYCAMEAGKSASACWCMSEPLKEVTSTLVEGDKCYCRRCLSEDRDG